MPQMSPIKWNFTSMLSYIFILILMTNTIYPLSKKNIYMKKTKKKTTNLIMW